MNILVITQLYPQPDDVGTNKPTKTVEYFAKEWIMSGHDVYVIHCPSKFPLVFYYAPKFVKNILGGSYSNIIPSIDSRRELYREEYGIKVKRYPMLKLLPGMGYSKRMVEKQAEIISVFINNNNFVPDFILGHFANPSTSLVSILSSKYEVRSSIVFHRDCNRRNIKKYKLSKWIDNINSVGARSILEAKQVKYDLNLARMPFICYSGVPNEAVDLVDKFCDKMNMEEGARHLFVGSFIKRKHLISVINAFVNSKKCGDTLVIVGSGVEEERLKKHTASIVKDNSVRFEGHIPRIEVIRHMKKAQIFTLISEGETYGMVYIEAMLQGCIVIASKDGGFDGIIIDGLNGFLCKPGDSKMLENIYKKISLMTIQEKNRIGQAAIATATYFSEKEVAKRYLLDVIQN
jgi:glycosyltransferase involved in cell wall biosynthesis